MAAPRVGARSTGVPERRPASISASATWTKVLARRLPPSFLARAARDALRARGDRAPATNFADETVRRAGETLAHAFWLPFAEKVWGRPAASLSPEQARRRVRAPSPLALARRVLTR